MQLVYYKWVRCDLSYNHDAESRMMKFAGKQVMACWKWVLLEANLMAYFRLWLRRRMKGLFYCYCMWWMVTLHAVDIRHGPRFGECRSSAEYSARFGSATFPNHSASLLWLCICGVLHLPLTLTWSHCTAVAVVYWLLVTTLWTEKNTPKCFLIYSLQNLTNCDKIWYISSWVNLSYRNVNIFHLTWIQWIVSVLYLVKLSICVLQVNSS